MSTSTIYAVPALLCVVLLIFRRTIYGNCRLQHGISLGLLLFGAAMLVLYVKDVFFQDNLHGFLYFRVYLLRVAAAVILCILGCKVVLKTPGQEHPSIKSVASVTLLMFLVGNTLIVGPEDASYRERLYYYRLAHSTNIRIEDPASSPLEGDALFQSFNAREMQDFSRKEGWFLSPGTTAVTEAVLTFYDEEQEPFCKMAVKCISNKTDRPRTYHYQGESYVFTSMQPLSVGYVFDLPEELANSILQIVRSS